MIDPVFKQRRLPHYYPEGADYFITYRLADSLPKQLILDINTEFVAASELEKLANPKFLKFEKYLDNPVNGPYWLQEDAIAKILFDSLKFFDGRKFLLDCCCIMPNHVHVLFSHLANTSPVYTIMKDHKGYTARACNKILSRTGQFWAEESYDHVVRTTEEFYNIRNYILMNPVKAGFVERWQDWKWNYLSPDGM